MNPLNIRKKTPMPSMSFTPQVRLAARICIVGGAGFFILAIAALTVPELAPGNPPVTWLQVLFAVLHLCQIAGIAAIGFTGAVGRAGMVGLWLAAGGAATFAVAELMVLISTPGSETAFGLGSLLTIVGLSIAGGSVLHQRTWDGPGRFLPLALGAYNLVLVLVLSTAPAQLGIVALALNAVLWTLLGWSLSETRSTVPLRGGLA